MVINNKNIQSDAVVEVPGRSVDKDVQVVTLCELGRLVLLEYTKKEFWLDAIDKIGGIESLLVNGIKRIR